MIPELRLETMKIRAADLGKESCVPDLLGEDILQNHWEFCLSEDDEIFEGYGKRKNVYPYRQYNCYHRELKEKEVKTAVLENDYLKAVFLPEYGGRLWELWDKKTGKNLLYTNDILQFANLAVRNAWFSGGVEWNIGVIGHHPYTTSCMYMAKTTTKTGAPVLRMYEFERIRKVPYQMEFWLEEEDRFLNCRMRIVNESEKVIPMYWWSNIAVPEHEGGRIVVPGKTAFTYRKGKILKVDVPIVNGVDITDYKKIPKSVDYFFDIPEDEPKYIANLDKGGYGLLHISTKRLKSRKLFSWGNGRASDHWQEFLTDKAGRYIEIQAGLGKTQYGCIPMAPHTTWEWIEQYGPVQMDSRNMKDSHEERVKQMTALVLKNHSPKQLEQKLKETKELAKTRASLLLAGSGYGALRKRGKLSEHLEFEISSESLRKWQSFFETGILHQPSVKEIPDDFLIDNENLKFLADTLEKENKGNWYAYYQAGVGYFCEEDYQNAEEALKMSWKTEKNPWACHALACTYLLTECMEQAEKWISRGLEMERNILSYIKDGFKILFFCKSYEKIIQFFERLSVDMQEVGRIKFYYISALHQLGEDQKAYDLMEENGGLLLEDIREGEDSIAKLWSELYQNLYLEEKPIPYRYDFKAIE